MKTKPDMTKLKIFKELTDTAAQVFGDVHFMEYKTPEGVAAKTYRQLKADADAFSSFLLSAAGKAAHVAMVGPACYNWAAAFFGVVNCGGVAVPLAPAETDDMNVKLVEFADVTVFVFDSAHLSLYKKIRAALPQVKVFVCISDGETPADALDFTHTVQNTPAVFFPAPAPDALCAIMYTSGTTGFPKGVMLTHENFLSAATYVHDSYPTQRMMGCLPFHHAFGLTGNITKTVVYGRTLCLNDDLKNLIADFRLYKPNGMLAVPQIVKFLMSAALRFAEEKKDEMTEPEAVRAFFGGAFLLISCGSAPLDKDLNDRWNATGIGVYNGYGMTECAPVVANNVGAFNKSGTVGKPIPCMQVKIENGEILLKGLNVMKGYYKNEEATKEAFTADGWLKTGDLGTLDEDGFLSITGRCKNLILLDNGENVSAEFLEEKFERFPFVKECICYGADGGVTVEAFVDQSAADPEAEMKRVLGQVNASLALHQQITAFVLRKTPFARTASRKIIRSDRQGSGPRETVPPATDADKKVVSAIRELLGEKPYSMTDSFFALGGNSLYAAQLAVQLGLQVQDIYANPTLQALASLISAAETDAGADRAGTEIIGGDLNALLRETADDAFVPPPETVLLTGATGFLGAHILCELIKSGCTVYALVRSRERLFARLDDYFGPALKNDPRLKVVAGDIEKRDLGLDEETYGELCKSVDSVFHTAANVRHAGAYETLRRTNVEGTKNVIAFCLAANAVLQHTSTVSLHGAATVIETTEHAVFDEDILDIGQHVGENVYIRSKFEAETAVLMARKQGLKANIYRIGNLTWRRSDGLFQENAADNGFLRRLHAILKLGLYHENMEKYPMDLTPVDDCAAAYVRLALTGQVGRVRHLYNPYFLKVPDLFALLGRPCRETSTAEAIELTQANIADGDMRVYMFYMLISGRSAQVEMRCEKTVNALADAGFCWHPVDAAYLEAGGHCRIDPAFVLKGVPERTEGLSPIGKLTLGVLKDTHLKTPVLLTGEGVVAQLPQAVKGLGVQKPLLVTVPFELPGIGALKDAFPGMPVFSAIAAEPTVSDTDAALKAYTENGCDGVIGVGGGSVLDVAKITALRAANPDRFIEDICKPDSVCENAVPLALAPSTAGTGSEATLFAVATELDKNKKRPFTSDRFLPDALALDPLLTKSVPQKSTAYTGIDALSHAVESALSRFASAFAEDASHAPEAVKLVFRHLPNAVASPGDLAARAGMQQAAYLAGKAFGRIGTGYIHAVAHRFGEFYHIPHGLAIAAAFTPVLRASLPEAEGALSRLAVETGIGSADKTEAENAGAMIGAVDALIGALPVDLSSIPFDPADARAIALKAQEEAKLIGYPHFFTDRQLEELVRTIMEKAKGK